MSTIELRSFLQARLPSALVPAAWVLLDALPTLPNGKVDRKALPAPERVSADRAASYVAPRTSLETVIVGVWARVLGRERVGVNDQFFDLGGHSLLATQVVAQLRSSLQVPLPVRTLFEAPTVAGMAEVLLRDPRQRRKIERTAQLLLELAQLSEDDVDALIAERTSERA